MTMTNEEPLFVLKYRWWRVLWRLFFPWIFILYVSFRVVFHLSPNYIGFKFWACELVAIIALIGGGWAVIDMLCCKEILLYKNCIVKRWHIFGERKVDFNTAMLDGVSSRHFPYPVSIKKFRKTDTYFLLGLIKGCFYNELLANAKDVKEMNRLLAKVTGREVAEFEKGSINNELPRSRAERGIKNLLLKQD